MTRKIDVAIITIRDDEYDAVFSRMPEPTSGSEPNRSYAFAELKDQLGTPISIALVKSTEQGPGPAGDVARDVIEDLDPHWIAISGIAGGFPDGDFTLGDIVIANRVHSFIFGGVKESLPPEFSDQGGPMHRQVVDLVDNIAVRRMAGWELLGEIGVNRPSVKPSRVRLYGSEELRESNRKNLKLHFVDNARQTPKAISGAIASTPWMCAHLAKTTVTISTRVAVVLLSTQAAGGIN